MKNVSLTHAVLLTLLHYDPDTGLFTWLQDKARAVKGSVAGNQRKSGYRDIQISGERFLAHRLAWFYVHKKWPSVHIDHIDLDPSNNRIANLREATNSQNMCNARTPKDNKTGVKGVCWDSNKGLWKAQINVGGVKVLNKRYESFEEAVAAVREVKEKQHREFARHE